MATERPSAFSPMGRAPDGSPFPKDSPESDDEETKARLRQKKVEQILENWWKPITKWSLLTKRSYDPKRKTIVWQKEFEAGAGTHKQLPTNADLLNHLKRQLERGFVKNEEGETILDPATSLSADEFKLQWQMMMNRVKNPGRVTSRTILSLLKNPKELNKYVASLMAKDLDPGREYDENEQKCHLQQFAALACGLLDIYHQDTTIEEDFTFCPREYLLYLQYRTTHLGQSKPTFAINAMAKLGLLNAMWDHLEAVTPGRGRRGQIDNDDQGRSRSRSVLAVVTADHNFRKMSDTASPVLLAHVEAERAGRAASPIPFDTPRRTPRHSPVLRRRRSSGMVSPFSLPLRRTNSDLSSANLSDLELEGSPTAVRPRIKRGRSTFRLVDADILEEDSATHSRALRRRLSDMKESVDRAMSTRTNSPAGSVTSRSGGPNIFSKNSQQNSGPSSMANSFLVDSDSRKVDRKVVDELEKFHYISAGTSVQYSESVQLMAPPTQLQRPRIPSPLSPLESSPLPSPTPPGLQQATSSFRGSTSTAAAYKPSTSSSSQIRRADRQKASEHAMQRAKQASQSASIATQSSPTSSKPGRNHILPQKDPHKLVEELCGMIKLTADEDEPAFDLLVIGCGGGPLEGNLSSYLVKAHSSRWQDGCVALEGGSTLGALSKLIENSPYSFTGFGLEIGVDAHEQEQETDVINSTQQPISSLAAKRNHPALTLTLPPSSSSSAPQRKRVGPGREGGGRSAGRVWDMIRCFAVSHAHLDHIQGLIISSGASLVPRPLYGVRRTLENIDRIFDGGVWPRLAGPEDDGVTMGRAYLYRKIVAPTSEPLPLSADFSFHAFPLSHGMDPSKFHKKPKVEGCCTENGSTHSETYDSTAFLVKESKTGKEKEFLFFGDVEPDSISNRDFNLQIWKAVAPKIAARKLSVIFLECSYPASQPVVKLWGHFSPPFVLEELNILANLVKQAKIAAGQTEAEAEHLPLSGVTVIIIHIKDDILPLPVVPSTTTESPSVEISPPPADAAHETRSNSASRSNSPTKIGLNPEKPLPKRPNEIARTSLTPSDTSSFSELNMSPPVPMVPQRRASSLSGLNPNSIASYPGRLSVDLTGWNEGRRQSMPFGLAGPWLQPGAGPFPLLGSASVRKRSGERLLAHENSSRRTSSDAGESIAEEDEEGQHDALNMTSLNIQNDSDEEETEEETVHERIERELNELENLARTGVRFLRAEQGMRIGQ